MIKECNVERCKNGYWTHPEYPEWEEYVSKYEVKEFEEKNKIMLYFNHFEYTASDKDIENYFDVGNCDISNWNPVCGLKNSFLLSIHDTEDGPIAIFAVKTKERLMTELSVKLGNF